jgi:hypothetical protein
MNKHKKLICKAINLNTLTYSKDYSNKVIEYGNMDYGYWNRSLENVATCVKIICDTKQVRIYSLKHFERIQ